MPKNERENVFVRVIKTFGVIIGAMVSLVFLLFLVIFLIAFFMPSAPLIGGNVAVVPIKGMITTDGSGDLFEKSGVESEKVVGWIKKADEDQGTFAILLEINSPGGSPVATDEIARAVKEANKPVVAVIRESGTSGAFWIAAAADYIFANRMSVTGSIGVIGSHLEFAGLLKDYNVTYRRLVAGQYKDAGSRWKEMTPEEQELFQKMLNKIQVEFVQEVSTNRKLPIEKVQEIANGFVLLGSEAKELGLIDALGNKDDAVKYIEQKFNITAKLYEFKPSKSFFEELIGVSSYNVGKGIGTALTTRVETDTVKITT